MINSKNKRKYNLFYDKVVDYHVRLLRMLRDPDKNKYSDNGYSKEYYALNKAKKDIKDRIKETLDVALNFSEIIQMGEFSQESRKHDGLPFQRLDQNKNLKKYELTGDEGSVRQEISEEAKEFSKDVFNEEIIERLLRVIFYRGYRISLTRRLRSNKMKLIEFDNEKFRNYRLNVAKLLVKKAIEEIKENLEPAYYDVLSYDLNRAVAICDAVKKKISDREWELKQQTRVILDHRGRR